MHIVYMYYMLVFIYYLQKAKNDLRGFDVELKKLHDKELLLRQQDKTLRDDKVEIVNYLHNVT